MKQVHIYYFSGTGNARHVAEWMHSEAHTAGLNSQVVNVSQNRMASEMIPDTMLGFISPTHGFNYPPLMIYFLLRMPATKAHQPVFLMNTRAGMKIGSLFLPGLSGIALWLAAFILWTKGYRIMGMRSVDMPSNWISLHPGYGPKTVSAIFARCEKKTRTFAQKIYSGKKVYRAALDIVQDALISPIAIAYFLIGRFVLSKTLYASRACNHCGKCIRECPVKAIYEVAGRPYWSFRCESCMRCMNNCPKRAIEAGHGMFAAIMVLVYTLVISTFYHYLPVSKWGIFNSESLLDKLARFTLESFIVFFFLVLCYRIIHHLRRYRWIDAMITYTSLTKLKFWRRYKAPE